MAGNPYEVVQAPNYSQGMIDWAALSDMGKDKDKKDGKPGEPVKPIYDLGGKLREMLNPSASGSSSDTAEAPSAAPNTQVASLSPAGGMPIGAGATLPQPAGMTMPTTFQGNAINVPTVGPTQDIIRATADRYGIDPNTMLASAHIESNMNPNASNGSLSSARGLFQHMTAPGGSWSEYGRGQNVYDPAANADATGRQWQDNAKYFRDKMGRDPVGSDWYAMHQQGRAGAVAMMQNPDAPVTQVLSRFYKNPETLRQVIVNNGGRMDMTAGQFLDKWRGAFDRRMGSLGPREPVMTGAPGFDLAGKLRGMSGDAPASGLGTADDRALFDPNQY